MRLFEILSAAWRGLFGGPVITIANSKSYPPATMLPPIKGGGRRAQVGNEITLISTVAGFPAFSVAAIDDGIAFPFSVPEGKIFCLTHVYLQTKYPWEPACYSGNMKAVYLQENGGVTVSSHHPDVHFDPPIPYFAGEKLLATISNSQSEAQNIIVMEQGFLIDADQPYMRLKPQASP